MGVNGSFVPLYEVCPGLKRQESQQASMLPPPPPAGLSQTLEELDSGCRNQTVFFPIAFPLGLFQWPGNEGRVVIATHFQDAEIAAAWSGLRKFHS